MPVEDIGPSAVKFVKNIAGIDDNILNPRILIVADNLIEKTVDSRIAVLDLSIKSIPASDHEKRKEEEHAWVEMKTGELHARECDGRPRWVY